MGNHQRTANVTRRYARAVTGLLGVNAAKKEWRAFPANLWP